MVGSRGRRLGAIAVGKEKERKEGWEVEVSFGELERKVEAPSTSSLCLRGLDKIALVRIV